MRKLRLLSIVIPCHNEEECIPVANGRITSIMHDMETRERINSFEILYIDNGSDDRTFDIARNIADKDPHVKVIRLRRNFGYQGSISAGLYFAKGDAVVTIDADLQDPPEKIEEMICHYENGYDLVLGVRSDRSSDSFPKQFFSNLFYALGKFLGMQIIQNHGDFRLMDASLVKEFNALTERNRFIRAMILQLDARYQTVSYIRQKRMKGKTKFNIHALFSLAFDGIVSFSFMPLRVASIMGILLFLLSIIGIFWVISIKLFANAIPPGWASTVLPIFLIGGFQLMFIGILGEYMGRIYIEVKQRPIFIVKEIVQGIAGQSDND